MHILEQQLFVLLDFQIIIKTNPTEDGLWNSPLTAHDFMLSVFDNKGMGNTESLNAISYIYTYILHVLTTKISNFIGIIIVVQRKTQKHYNMSLTVNASQKMGSKPTLCKSCERINISINESVRHLSNGSSTRCWDN